MISLPLVNGFVFLFLDVMDGWDVSLWSDFDIDKKKFVLKLMTWGPPFQYILRSPRKTISDVASSKGIH